MIRRIITSQQRRVIVDVDTQQHFFTEKGIVCVINHHQVLANIRRTVAWARLENIPTISTVQICAPDLPFYSFYECGLDGQKKISYTLRNKRTSFMATDSTDLPLGILNQYDQIIFQKRCFDPFREPLADRMLTELHADEFILIGALTEGAVKATAFGLLARRKNVTILVDAIGSYNEYAAERVLRHMWAKGAKLTDTRTFLGSCLRLVKACNCDHKQGQNYKETG